MVKKKEDNLEEASKKQLESLKVSGTPKDKGKKIVEPGRKLQGSKKKTVRRSDEKLVDVLSPHVTSWEIVPNPVTNGETQILVFYVNGKTVTHIEINVDNMSELLDALNSNLIVETNSEITGWSIREPEDSSLPPIFSLTSYNAVVGSIPLDVEVVKKLVPKFLKIYNPHKPTFERLLTWVFKHKVLASTLGIFLITIFVYPLISGIIFSA